MGIGGGSRRWISGFGCNRISCGIVHDKLQWLKGVFVSVIEALSLEGGKFLEAELESDKVGELVPLWGRWICLDNCLGRHK